MRRFHTIFHNGIYHKQSNNEINFNAYMESLTNPSKDSQSSEEESDTDNIFEVKITIDELLVCFLLFSVGLIFSVIVFILEVLIFIKGSISQSENE